METLSKTKCSILYYVKCYLFKKNILKDKKDSDGLYDKLYKKAIQFIQIIFWCPNIFLVQFYGKNMANDYHLFCYMVLLMVILHNRSSSMTLAMPKKFITAKQITLPGLCRIIDPFW